MTGTDSDTLLDAIIASVRRAGSAADGASGPAAVLWTDPEQHWVSLRPLLREAIPEFLELGEYAPGERRGPAIWLRCLVDRTLGEPVLPVDRPPILYLPGVSRQSLRAGEETPPALRPLVELMFRGALFLQRSGNDWTSMAFLTSEQGLGLNIARDRETAEALRRALPEVARTPLETLRGKPLSAGDFDRLLTSDVVRDILRWMGAPAEARDRMGAAGWDAFCSQCRQIFNFDPQAEDLTVAGQRLGLAEKRWAEAWARFNEAPQAFPGIVSLLRRSKPASMLLFEKSHWPDDNDRAEDELRAALREACGRPHDAACSQVLDLEQAHGVRRGWVWARLGHSSLAMVLAPLAVLAREARTVPGGSTPDDIARAYEARGWLADVAAWEALALTGTADEELIRQVVQALHEPWLEQSAQVFQRVAEAQPLPGASEVDIVSADEGACVLFVDGLRYDLGRRLSERLESRGMRVHPGRRWAALPTVTATAKVAVSPVADSIVGVDLPADFSARHREDGRPVVAASLRSALTRRGYQVLDGSLADWPANDRARGWAEVGQIDALGHKLGADLPRQIGAELDRLVERIAALLEAGWREVRIVTDHGWLLLPLGLPKVELPKHLTASRWARCAAIVGHSQVSVPTFAWHWNSAQRYATAPGIGCFNVAIAYAHGGISVQECLIPDVRVQRAIDTQARASITSLHWQGMRCFVRADVSGTEVRAQLRLGRPNGPPATKSRLVEAQTETSLLVEDDAHELQPLILVLLSPDDTILAQRPTSVGATS